MSISFPFSKYLMPASFAVMIFLTACSEDSSPFSQSSEKYLRFNVEVSSGWNFPRQTRANEKQDAGKLKVLSMAYGSDSLYMVPKVIDGINLATKDFSTRSSLINKETMASFGVFASLKPESASSVENLKADYMYNVEVTRENSWSPAEEYLWPGSGSLHFNAYSPFCSEPSSSGITSLPSKDNSGTLALSYMTPEDVADQFDFLIAIPAEAASSPCDITFNHALTAIRFATGTEMTPCTVKKIEISGVNASGSVNLENGEWSRLSSPTTFSVSPEISLTAADGSKFVAPDTYITSESQTFLLIPQTLPEDAQISMTIECEGVESTMTASLAGTTWSAGKTVVYRLSANPATDSFILQITDSDGKPISSLQSLYTGTTLQYQVRSVKQLADGDSVPVAWKADFIDESGNVIERPQWISDFIVSGSASEKCEATTVLQEPTFLSMSEDTRTLRNTPDINTSSGMTPYNLSNSSGAPAVENTSNCYLIKAPGQYSIPLVYGNAIKGGAPYPSSYTTTSTNRYALKTFLNHLGNPISDPYIYNNAGCTPASASLVWEGRLCLVQDVALSEDKRSLNFTVPDVYISQGNALLCVKDGDGNIMWSWQIWVTPYDLEANVQTVSSSGITEQLLSRNLGQITNGDDTLYPACSAKVRFTQIPDDGSEPLTTVISIDQNEKEIKTPDCYSFFQWGRKDPMISDIKDWYDPSHHEITTFSRQDYDSYSGTLPMISEYIRTPETFWTSSHDKAHQYINLWNTDLSTSTNTKSIYDPSPVGFKVTFGKIFNEFVNHGSIREVYSTEDTRNTGFYISIAGSPNEIFFPAYGYLQSSSGMTNGYGSNGQVWSTYYDGTHDRALLTNARALVFSSSSITFPTDPRAFGFGVRPEKE